MSFGSSLSNVSSTFYHFRQVKSTYNFFLLARINKDSYLVTEQVSFYDIVSAYVLIFVTTLGKIYQQLGGTKTSS